MKKSRKKGPLVYRPIKKKKEKKEGRKKKAGSDI
jgi:hypothetical protein